VPVTAARPASALGPQAYPPSNHRSPPVRCDGAAAGPRMSCGEKYSSGDKFRRISGSRAPGIRGTIAGYPDVVA